MRRTTINRRALSVATALVLAAGTAAALIPGSAFGQGEIHLFSPVGDERGTVFDDLNGNGRWDVGDRLVFTPGALVDPTTDESVAVGTGECLVLRRIRGDDRGLFRCTYTIRFGTGDLLLSGLDRHGLGPSPFAVLGGTGDYAGASGDATYTDSLEGTDIVIRLLV